MAILVSDTFDYMTGATSLPGKTAPTGGTWASSFGDVAALGTGMLTGGAGAGNAATIGSNHPVAVKATTTHVYKGAAIGGPYIDGPGLCFDNAGNGYSVQWQYWVPALRIVKWAGGSYSTLLQITAGLPAAPSTIDSTLTLTLQRDSDGTLRASVDGVERGSVVDTSYTAGKFAVLAVSQSTLTNGIPITGFVGEDVAVSMTPMNLGSLSTTAAASASVSSSAWAAQSARPTADVSAGTWTASAGGSLFAAIDEVTADDADYISYTATGTCRVRFGALSDPGSDPNPVRVSYRIAGDGSAGQTVKLYSSTTLIATWTHTPAPATATTYTQTLTSGQRAAITNWSLLELEVTGT